MKHVDVPGLPPCSQSAQCLRFLDELEAQETSKAFEQISFTEDMQDERLLAKLRLHIPDCPTCTAVLAQARRLRSQQRMILHNYLFEAESRVPSTTPQIFAAIQSEQRTASEAEQKRLDYYLPEIVLPPGIQQLNGKRASTTGPLPSKQRLLSNALALATVAAIIIVAAGLFDRMLTRSTLLHPGQKAAVDTHGWNEAVIGLTIFSAASGAARSMTRIYNYNPASERHEQLLPPIYADAIQLDSITRDGQNLLYHYSSGGQTEYATLTPLPGTGFFYQQDKSNTGNVVWMDSRTVLIATVRSGIEEVDIQTGAHTSILPTLKTIGLAFYRAPYLYFVGAEDRAEGALYRVNTSNPAETPLQVTMPSPGSTYWLSPDGTTVFYANKGPAGEQIVYAVENDGTNLRILRRGDVTPIGYASNNALMFMQEVDGKFQVVQLGATPQEKEQVVLADAAPGATSLCDQAIAPGIAPICDTNIALAPYGYGLILHAYYADGTHKVLYDDLATGQRSVLLSFASNDTAQVQLPGWDRIPVPGTQSKPGSTPTVTVTSFSAGTLLGEVSPTRQGFIR